MNKLSKTTVAGTAFAFMMSFNAFAQDASLLDVPQPQEPPTDEQADFVNTEAMADAIQLTFLLGALESRLRLNEGKQLKLDEPIPLDKDVLIKKLQLVLFKPHDLNIDLNHPDVATQKMTAWVSTVTGQIDKPTAKAIFGFIKDNGLSSLLDLTTFEYLNKELRAKVPDYFNQRQAIIIEAAKELTDDLETPEKPDKQTLTLKAEFVVCLQKELFSRYKTPERIANFYEQSLSNPNSIEDDSAVQKCAKNAKKLPEEIYYEVLGNLNSELANIHFKYTEREQRKIIIDNFMNGFDPDFSPDDYGFFVNKSNYTPSPF